MANMVFLNGSPTHYFYLHLLVIHDLGALISFTLFEVDFFETVNVNPSQVTPKVWSVIRVFKIICR